MEKTFNLKFSQNFVEWKFSLMSFKCETKIGVRKFFLSFFCVKQFLCWKYAKYINWNWDEIFHAFLLHPFITINLIRKILALFHLSNIVERKRTDLWRKSGRKQETKEGIFFRCADGNLQFCSVLNKTSNLSKRKRKNGFFHFKLFWLIEVLADRFNLRNYCQQLLLIIVNNLNWTRGERREEKVANDGCLSIICGCAVL